MREAGAGTGVVRRHVDWALLPFTHHAPRTTLSASLFALCDAHNSPNQTSTLNVQRLEARTPGFRRSKSEATGFPDPKLMAKKLFSWPSIFSSTDEQAMWRVRTDDDADAFAKLVARWQGPIQNLCARMIGDAHRGEDLAQDTFARLYARRKNY